MFVKVWDVGQHKVVEMAMQRLSWHHFFNINLQVMPRGYDHAGVYFSVTLIGLMFELNFYDTRHADDE